MKLLFVCTANILRSASAEALARRHLLSAGRTDWALASAGIRALVGHGIDSDAAAVFRQRGWEIPEHRARQLTAPLLRDADLTITFEARHRQWAITEEPRRARSIVTIRRAAATLAVVPSGEDALGRVRADAAPYTEADEFDDPYGEGEESIAAAIDEIDRLLGVIIPALLAGPER